MLQAASEYFEVVWTFGLFLLQALMDWQESARIQVAARAKLMMQSR